MTQRGQFNRNEHGLVVEVGQVGASAVLHVELLAARIVGHNRMSAARNLIIAEIEIDAGGFPTPNGIGTISQLPGISLSQVLRR